MRLKSNHTYVYISSGDSVISALLMHSMAGESSSLLLIPLREIRTVTPRCGRVELQFFFDCTRHVNTLNVPAAINARDSGAVVAYHQP